MDNMSASRTVTTVREYAAIQLRVPDSGTEWLDAMIRKSNRAEFMRAALSGRVFTADANHTPKKQAREIAKKVNMIAEACMSESEGADV